MLFFALLMALIGLAAASDLTDFLLVTTTSPASFGNVAALPDVSAMSLFDPFHQPSYNLRLIGPGYGSLPCFNLTNGFLHTKAAGPYDFVKNDYYGAIAGKAELLEFSTKAASGGCKLSLEKGFLLAVDGDVKGWTVCDGDLQQQVLVWKGNDTSCVERYVQAVKQAPY